MSEIPTAREIRYNATIATFGQGGCTGSLPWLGFNAMPT